eukprot:scaffold1519_cov99-Isochrysis_galbana.AAC.3
MQRGRATRGGLAFGLGPRTPHLLHVARMYPGADALPGALSLAGDLFTGLKRTLLRVGLVAWSLGSTGSMLAAAHALRVRRAGPRRETPSFSLFAACSERSP